MVVPCISTSRDRGVRRERATLDDSIDLALQVTAFDTVTDFVPDPKINHLEHARRTKCSSKIRSGCDPLMQ